MKTKPDFRNLRVVPSGFQVAIMREGVQFSKHFARHTVESYSAAIEHRDRLLRRLARKGATKAPSAA